MWCFILCSVLRALPPRSRFALPAIPRAPRTADPPAPWPAARPRVWPERPESVTGARVWARRASTSAMASSGAQEDPSVPVLVAAWRRSSTSWHNATASTTPHRLKRMPAAAAEGHVCVRSCVQSADSGLRVDASAAGLAAAAAAAGTDADVQSAGSGLSDAAAGAFSLL